MNEFFSLTVPLQECFTSCKNFLSGLLAEHEFFSLSFLSREFFLFFPPPPPIHIHKFAFFGMKSTSTKNFSIRSNYN